MQLSFTKPTAAQKAEILAFKDAFLQAGETVINGSAGLDFYPGFEEWLAYLQAVESGEEEGFVPSEVYLAREAGSARVVGILDIRPRLPEEKQAFGHIGYATLPAARGRGIATEMVTWGVKQLAGSGLTQLLACCYEDNTASRKTLEKNRFESFGTYKEDETGFTIVKYRRIIEA